MKRVCKKCFSNKYDKGRDFDGRRCYRCVACGYEWTEGLQGMKRKRFSAQRFSFQFKDTGSGQLNLKKSN